MSKTVIFDVCQIEGEQKQFKHTSLPQLDRMKPLFSAANSDW